MLSVEQLTTLLRDHEEELAASMIRLHKNIPADGNIIRIWTDFLKKEVKLLQKQLDEATDKRKIIL